MRYTSICHACGSETSFSTPVTQCPICEENILPEDILKSNHNPVDTKS